MDHQQKQPHLQPVATAVANQTGPLSAISHPAVIPFQRQQQYEKKDELNELDFSDERATEPFTLNTVLQKKPVRGASNPNAEKVVQGYFEYNKRRLSADEKIKAKKGIEADVQDFQNHIKMYYSESLAIAFEAMFNDDRKYNLSDWIASNFYNLNVSDILQEIGSEMDPLEKDEEETELSLHYENLKDEIVEVDNENLLLLALFTSNSSMLANLALYPNNKELNEIIIQLNERIADYDVDTEEGMLKVASLEWAVQQVSERRRFDNKKGGGSSSLDAEVELTNGDEIKSVQITGRPGFSRDAAALPIEKGQHRRHVIAWHTIRKATENVINKSLELDGEASLGQHLQISSPEDKAYIEKQLEEIAAKQRNLEGKSGHWVKKQQDKYDKKNEKLSLLIGKDTEETNSLSDKDKKQKRTAAAIEFFLDKWNSNIKNLWPGPGYENSLINVYQQSLRGWAEEYAEITDPREKQEWVAAKVADLDRKIQKRKKSKAFTAIAGSVKEILEQWLENAKDPQYLKEQDAIDIKDVLVKTADTYENDYPYLGLNKHYPAAKGKTNPENRKEELDNIINSTGATAEDFTGDQFRLFNQNIVIEPDLLVIGGELLQYADGSHKALQSKESNGKILADYMELMERYMNAGKKMEAQSKSKGVGGWLVVLSVLVLAIGAFYQYSSNTSASRE